MQKRKAQDDSAVDIENKKTHAENDFLRSEIAAESTYIYENNYSQTSAKVNSIVEANLSSPSDGDKSASENFINSLALICEAANDITTSKDELIRSLRMKIYEKDEDIKKLRLKNNELELKITKVEKDKADMYINAEAVGKKMKSYKRTIIKLN